MWGAASSSQSPHRYVLTSFASLAPPLRAGLVRSTVRPFPTRLVSLVGSPWLAGISRSAPLLVLSRRRRKLRIPHPAASGRLRPLRCSGSPSERHSAFRWVPHSASLGSRGAPDLRAKPRRDVHRPGGGEVEAQPLPVPHAQAVTAVAGPPWGRKDAGRPPDTPQRTNSKKPLFLWIPKTVSFSGREKEMGFESVLLPPSF